MILPLASRPDGLAFDPAWGGRFVSDEHGPTDTLIDAPTEPRVATLQLGGGAGNPQLDPASGRRRVDLQTLNRLVAMDPKAKTVLPSYPPPGGERSAPFELLAENPPPGMIGRKSAFKPRGAG